MQFLWLSAFKKLNAFGLGPWVAYAGLGVAGILGQAGDQGLLGGIAGCAWEALASNLGGGPVTGGAATGSQECKQP
jgi:hypothetical protein